MAHPCHVPHDLPLLVAEVLSFMTEGLLGVHIDPVARNRLRLNRIELGGIFKPVLEPLLRRD